MLVELFQVLSQETLEADLESLKEVIVLFENARLIQSFVDHVWVSDFTVKGHLAEASVVYLTHVAFARWSFLNLSLHFIFV